MKSARTNLKIALLTMLAATPAASYGLDAPEVSRSSSDTLTLRWTGKGKVDVYVADRSDATVDNARLISDDDRDGKHDYRPSGSERPYFLLVEGNTQLRVAERLLPLEQGSNFRDIGGYATTEGKHVRWGMIFRSGGTPMLTDKDRQQIAALGLQEMVDLRSSEERVIAPSLIEGVPYVAVGYSMASMMPRATGSDDLANSHQRAYLGMPAGFAPQLRVVFDALLRKEAPLAYNCSAGQDRTGFTTAMILSALGVPRETIYADYHLSTAYRRPEFEMPKIDTALHANNPVALYFAKYQADPHAAKPQPLMDATGKAYLADAFAVIEERWGSVEAYLEQEVGVDRVEIAALRAMYLE